MSRNFQGAVTPLKEAPAPCTETVCASPEDPLAVSSALDTAGSCGIASAESQKVEGSECVLERSEECESVLTGLKSGCKETQLQGIFDLSNRVGDGWLQHGNSRQRMLRALPLALLNELLSRDEGTQETAFRVGRKLVSDEQSAKTLHFLFWPALYRISDAKKISDAGSALVVAHRLSSFASAMVLAFQGEGGKQGRGERAMEAFDLVMEAVGKELQGERRDIEGGEDSSSGEFFRILLLLAVSLWDLVALWNLPSPSSSSFSSSPSESRDEVLESAFALSLSLDLGMASRNDRAFASAEASGVLCEKLRDRDVVDREAVLASCSSRSAAGGWGLRKGGKTGTAELNKIRQISSALRRGLSRQLQSLAPPKGRLAAFRAAEAFLRTFSVAALAGGQTGAPGFPGLARDDCEQDASLLLLSVQRASVELRLSLEKRLAFAEGMDEEALNKGGISSEEQRLLFQSACELTQTCIDEATSEVGERILESLSFSRSGEAAKTGGAGGSAPASVLTGLFEGFHRSVGSALQFLEALQSGSVESQMVHTLKPEITACARLVGVWMAAEPVRFEREFRQVLPLLSQHLDGEELEALVPALFNLEDPADWVSVPGLFEGLARALTLVERSCAEGLAEADEQQKTGTGKKSDRHEGRETRAVQMESLLRRLRDIGAILSFSCLQADIGPDAFRRGGIGGTPVETQVRSALPPCPLPLPPLPSPSDPQRLHAGREKGADSDSDTAAIASTGDIRKLAGEIASENRSLWDRLSGLHTGCGRVEGRNEEGLVSLVVLVRAEVVSVSAALSGARSQSVEGEITSSASSSSSSSSAISEGMRRVWEEVADLLLALAPSSADEMKDFSDEGTLLWLRLVRASCVGVHRHAGLLGLLREGVRRRGTEAGALMSTRVPSGEEGKRKGGQGEGDEEDGGEEWNAQDAEAVLYLRGLLA
uniref:Uncharacterized protein n=1 Tax=Chromera velia CCMP2878 TaxID=1169474 RepID=A0A0G4H4U2_9ALVE|eukprot:Cvel_5683.t1-p1 / transcript=Cvel_5683.t1 / gene=Cvel_5683 / organism=Chromera_velia_CCMP2878 / gene_product=hypothetical protein / transcript_product=hypothetical protein / location=Cvel_scaffold268:94506-100573(-) / protein_length=939 / sequence_SO=supercontig / SO=protein_coding / is_pseudo=false